jgi:alpha-tubulin suppressor-like RCC1 family protein
LAHDGGVWCWGANEGGQLGDGTTKDAPRATMIRDFPGTAQLVASGASTCARLQNGTVRCWGWNNDGQLGDGTRVGHALPKAVRGLEHVSEIAIGASTGCALRGGTVICWGEEARAPYRDEEHRSLFPVEHTGLGRVTSLAAMGQIEGHHLCVVAGGAVRCWGKNDHGQLGGPAGDEPTTVRFTPQSVYGLAR